MIEVYDKLHMLSPDVTAEELLMAPNSALRLQTNRYLSPHAPSISTVLDASDPRVGCRNVASLYEFFSH